MANELSVNHETMRKLVVEDLGLKSFKRKKVHHLNPSIRTKKLVRSKSLLQRSAPGAQDNILFSDEKIFTIEEVVTDKMVGSCYQFHSNSRKPEIHQ
ncbi:Transposase [Oopsacas minuta]|uniref:Transposase n=1 Tax=Oopsacas minuta TaxID=111878 RepID=A0AAV7JEG6_9METZ|nr:Transposase [Oopsacas minuta]